MKKKYIKKSLELDGRTLTLEVNKVAPQANTSVIARYGDTELLVTVVSANSKPNQAFFPLTIDYVERLYAGGIIKGSRWVKREGRPTDEAILTARLIDRSTRPLFPKDFLDEVQVVVTLLSTDGANDHDILALIATSAALHLSSVPWNGPIGAVRMGYVSQPDNNGLVVNPQIPEMEFSDLDLVVSANSDGVVMVEAGAKELPEDKMTDATVKAFEECQKIIKFIEGLRKEVGLEKYTYTPHATDETLQEDLEKNHLKEIMDLVITDDPSSKPETGKLEELKKSLIEQYTENPNKNQIGEIVDLIVKKNVRKMVTEKKVRSDGRKVTQVRPITIEVGLLPRTHGSALFQRGLTQVLSVVTLASPSLEQWIETAEGMEEKHYMHHYSDPPYCMGEVGRMGSVGRREIGHGALAERALAAVVPNQTEFPYTIRVVSEVMSSNGSTSMGSTCGSTLALMDAGVPLKAPVSGVAMGIIANSADEYTVLTDIAAYEDFYGNMDFKVAGTETGITALQLDVKLYKDFKGLTPKMIGEIYTQARVGRMFIMEKMLETIPQTRATVSQFAPKVATIKVPVEKIGEIIGPGGKNIKNIIATTTADVDINDDGTVTVSSIDPIAVEKAVAWISGMVRELVIGEEFDGTVKRILPFGAFVEVLPGKEGLVHVSKMTAGFVSDPNQVVQIGQTVHVKVVEIDEMGRVNLAMYWGPKEAPPEGMMMENQPRPSFGNRPSFGGNRNSGNRGGFGRR